MTEGPKRTVPEWRVEADRISPTDWHVYAADGTHIAQGIFSKDLAALIVAACNACQQINPQNPQAIAAGLDDLVSVAHACQSFLRHLSDECLGMAGAAILTHLRAALASIESR